MTQSSLPARNLIVKYWSQKVLQSDICTDWDRATEFCWACGYKARIPKTSSSSSEDSGSPLDRCHIIAAAMGGSCEPENFVLLCNPCHGESPSVSDPEVMWNWIKKRASEQLCMKGIPRAVANVYPLTLSQLRPLAKSKADIALLMKCVKELMPQLGMHAHCTRHKGPGISAASLEWMVMETKKMFLETKPSKAPRKL